MSFLGFRASAAMDLDDFDEGTEQPNFDDTLTESKATPRSTLSFANSPLTPNVATPTVCDPHSDACN